MNRSSTRARVEGSLFISGVLACVGTIAAGPTDPPAGPVAPTFKTLTEVEPRTAINATNTPGDADSVYRIAAPGSYYLTGNVTGESGKSGIEVDSDGVMIDLMGFGLQGVAGSLDGIRMVNQRSSITIINGEVKEFGEDGIDLRGDVAGIRGRIEGVHVSDNGGRGIVGNLLAVVRDCTVNFNGGVGIFVGSTSTVENCVLFSNAENNIDAEPGCVIVGCASTGGGIRASSSCTITDCTVIAAPAGGIITEDLCVLQRCVVQNSQTHGISVGPKSTVTDCNVSCPVAIGITAAESCRIEGCVSSGNASDGIRVTSSCVVRGNTCDGNGALVAGAGIRVEGSDNRIEGNNCTNADRGLDVNSAGNIIIRNTCSGNTAANWDIVANNVCGPIIDRTAPGSAAINGNSAPDSTRSEHPNANATYRALRGETIGGTCSARSGLTHAPPKHQHREHERAEKPASVTRDVCAADREEPSVASFIHPIGEVRNEADTAGGGEHIGDHERRGSKKPHSAQQNGNAAK